jgi:quinohemoprotein amine dehydrogenase
VILSGITASRSALRFGFTLLIAAASLNAPSRVLGADSTASPTADAGGAGLTTVRTYCAACHTESPAAHFQRVSVIRKSPEGWLMTIVRMQHVHGLALPDDARDVLIKYLSDTQGLAPSESAAGRFALERRPNAPDLQLGDDLPVLCGRCHSLARVSLQRRDADEWLKHMHMHVGQFPSLEYQASSRDRYWWQTATTVLPGKLAELFPFDTPQWRAWRDQKHADPTGEWLVRGRAPGHGDYFGTLSVVAKGADAYAAQWSVQHADGKTVTASSIVRIYTGYEWRGTAKWGEMDVREVFALSEDGRRLSGRWFDALHTEVGGDVIADRADGAAAVLAVSPRALKTGVTQEVVIAGRGLKGAVNFGPGTKAKVLGSAPGLLRVSVSVDAKAAVGVRSVSVGKTSAPHLAVIYDQVDRVQVLPGYAIARVGGGKIDPVSAQFEAIGYLEPRANGTVHEPIELGPVDVKWKVAPRNEEATKADDVKFAGNIDAAGRFTPGAAGPNPERKYASNNAGDLSVIASLEQGGKEVHGDSHLIVSVQRWVSPPIY